MDTLDTSSALLGRAARGSHQGPDDTVVLTYFDATWPAISLARCREHACGLTAPHDANCGDVGVTANTTAGQGAVASRGQCPQ